MNDHWKFNVSFVGGRIIRISFNESILMGSQCLNDGTYFNQRKNENVGFDTAIMFFITLTRHPHLPYLNLLFPSALVTCSNSPDYNRPKHTPMLNPEIPRER